MTKGTISTGSVFHHTQIWLDEARRAVGHPGCPLRFTVIACPGEGKPPRPLTLNARSDFDAVQNDIYAYHLMMKTPTPFSLMVEPDFSQARIVREHAATTILSIEFGAGVASRQLGWLRHKPPAAPDIVSSAKLLPGSWRMDINLEREAEDDLVPAEEPTTLRWGPDRSTGEFRTALATTLRGIEYGHEVSSFGVIDDFNALGRTGGAVVVTPEVANVGPGKRPVPPRGAGKKRFGHGDS